MLGEGTFKLLEAHLHAKESACMEANRRGPAQMPEEIARARGQRA